MMKLFQQKQLLSTSLWRPLASRAFSRDFSHQDPFKTLGVSRKASMEEIKHAYRELCKQYHPDVCDEPDAAERFKKISYAYHVIKTEFKDGHIRASGHHSEASAGRRDYEHSSSTTYRYTSSSENNKESEESSDKYEDIRPEERDEDIYYRIFGRSFKSDPGYFYKKENEHLRKKYESEIAQKRKEAGETHQTTGKTQDFYRDPEEEEFWRAYMRERNQKYNKAESSSTGVSASTSGASEGISEKTLKMAVAGLLVTTGLVGFMFWNERGKSTARFEKSASDLERVRDNFLKREEEKKEKKRADFADSLALMKKYPRRNPNAISMLVDYSIWNDIKLFSVPYGYFHGYNDEGTLKTGEFDKNRIHNVKLNTMVTLAIESERVLKHVHVKVDDVLESLKETGHFKPPGVFFRYYGYIHLKIRRKPIIVENLQEAIQNKEKTISLFDLFFRYSTPILIANDEYYEIPLKHHAYIADTTTKEGIGWVGNAHINYRGLDKKIYNMEDKNVFMWRGPAELTSSQYRYLRTWDTHYPLFHKSP